MEYGTQRGRGAAAEQTTQAANGGKVARAKRGRPALETSSESEAEEPRPALKRLKSTAKTNQKLASAAKTSKPGKSQQQGIAAWLKKEGTPAAEPEPMPNSAAGEGPVELPAPSQKQVRCMAWHLLCSACATSRINLQATFDVTPTHLCICMSSRPSWRLGAVEGKIEGWRWQLRLVCTQAGKGPHQQTGSQKAAKLATETTTGLLAVEGEVPIMMPAKLATNKACAVFDIVSVALQLLSQHECTHGPQYQSLHVWISCCCLCKHPGLLPVRWSIVLSASYSRLGARPT